MKHSFKICLMGGRLPSNASDLVDGCQLSLERSQGSVLGHKHCFPSVFSFPFSVGCWKCFYGPCGSGWKMIWRMTALNSHRRRLLAVSRRTIIHHPQVTVQTVAADSHGTVRALLKPACTRHRFPEGRNIWRGIELNFSWHLYTSTKASIYFSTPSAAPV